MTNQNMTNFAPTAALIVYQRQNSYYLQVHQITKSGEGYAWGAGKPFQREDLQALADSIRKDASSSVKLAGLMPENVLYYQPSLSGDRFCWWIPPGEHHLVFVPALKLKAGMVKSPGLIFAVKGKNLSVLAFKGKKPTPKSALFHAPFWNMYDDGGVCMGTTSETRKKAYLHEELDRWERRFFGSRFTDNHGDGQLTNGYKMKELYKSLLNGKPFPENALKPFKHKKLELFIKSFAS